MANQEYQSKSNLELLTYAICVVIIVAIATSNLFLLNISGSIADHERENVQSRLIANEIERQKQILVRDQSQISYWSKTVRALGPSIKQRFIREEVVNWLWADFDIQRTVIVGPDNQPRVTVFENNQLDPAEGVDVLAGVRDLVDDAQNSYLRHRKKTSEGYAHEHNPLDESDPGYAADIRTIEGVLGVAVAQAIVPDGDVVLPDGNAHVLVTFKPFGKAITADINANLGLRDFRLATSPTILSETDRAGSRTEIRIENNRTPLFVSWSPAKPSKKIWTDSKLSLLTIFSIVVVGIAFVAIHFGRTLKALQVSEQKNHFLALHDVLTGLPNRLHFDRELELIVEQNAQDRCAILCVDLDRFKAVNDTYGHQAGDVAIKAAAERIRACVGESGLVARTGGDEFIILLHDKLDKNHVLWLCDRIIELVSKKINFEGGSASIGASIGVAWWPDDALTAKSVIRSADEALYRAKQNGRNCAKFAEASKTMKGETPLNSANSKAA